MAILQAALVRRSLVKWSFSPACPILEVSQRAPIRGPAFIRLLARLSDMDVPAHGPALSEQLSQWIDWTRAVALSRALDGRLAAADTSEAGLVADAVAACTQARATLATAIAAGPDLAAMAPANAATGTPAQLDYAVFRQHYLARQRAMQVATGPLRGRLRDLLAQGPAQMARLAEVDALMEGVLSPREHALLAAVPGLLGQHFAHLQQTAQPAVGHATHATAPWLARFLLDMQGLLLAELDVRFFPIEGLLAALHTSSQDAHAQTFA